MTAQRSVEEVHSAPDPEAMGELGVRLGRVLRAGDLVILTGPLGAGKTTLTRGIGEGLGVRGPVQSPTFVLARTHPSLIGGAPLVHVDAYRLAGPDELDDLDLDFEGSVVVAEWGAGIVETRADWVEIVIERPLGDSAAAGARVGAHDAENGAISHEDPADWSEALVEPRRITVTGYGARWAEGVLG